MIYFQSSRLLQSYLIERHLPKAVCVQRMLHTASMPHSRAIVNKVEPSNVEGHDAKMPPRPTPLSILPLPNLIRSFVVTSLSSSPALLSMALRTLSYLAHSPSLMLNPERNPLLHLFLKKAFYDQFCAGETPSEVRETIQRLKQVGFSGVMLAYGKEIVLDHSDTADSARKIEEPAARDKLVQGDSDVQQWKQGALKTIDLTHDGDFAALKYTGAGKEAVRLLMEGRSTPSKEISDALTEICEAAKARGVGLLFDAEQNVVQKGIDSWTLALQRKYNQDKAVVYNTYQAYLHSMPTVLLDHLHDAQRNGYVLGVKLVRGAYLASDPKELFCDDKTLTDQNFDGIAEALLTRDWNVNLKPPDKLFEFPGVDVALATHNQDSVNKALHIQERRRREGKPVGGFVIGQLMGMADEISCDLVLANRRAGPEGHGPRAYQYLVWGSVRDCLKYLIRRAEENRDASVRARSTALALAKEIMRRVRL